ncbi:ER-derived vesicles protein erv29 [Malassezia caprae]|uniref:ER-derived vesicles protein erv29 n=1 Tax=Malassezia caprae TaxID=1381934 RepID=A0AAF0IWF8_9BASI|nr:ER-derived vesicles protein erv29 [Malassezia caprae]
MSYGHSSFVPPSHMHNDMYASRMPSHKSPWMETLEEYSSKAEDIMDIISQPIRPYIPALGRFLIVVTFLEDALRITTQWNDQMTFLHRFRSMPSFIAGLFLIINVVLMTVASICVIIRRFPEISVGSLLFVIVFQGLGYGLITDFNFFLRNLSVVGGLLMVFSDSLANRRKNLFAGLPSMSETDKRIYFQLAGRILLIVLFIGFVFQGEWGFFRVAVSILGLGACIMVAVGFKARYSAMFLVLLLSILNIAVNNFWTVHSAHPQRDFLRYDFFQTLSIVGGLILLVSMGPGGFSMDERKKVT